MSGTAELVLTTFLPSPTPSLLPPPLCLPQLENERLLEDNKGCYNVIRAKDREIDDLAAQAARADQVLSLTGHLGDVPRMRRIVHAP